MRLLYRPKHPKADELGMVDANLLEYEPRQTLHVISDTMEAARHHGTGQVIDSKAKFRQATKASGCIEVGNEAIKPRQPVKLDKRERREAIRKTIYELRNGHA